MENQYHGERLEIGGRNYLNYATFSKIFSQNTGSFENYVQTLGGLSPISKHLEVRQKIFGFALYFQLLSVFENRRKSSYLCLKYYS